MKRHKFFTKNPYRILLFAAILLLIVLNFSHLLGLINWLWGVLFPLILGGCIAYVVNMLMDWFSVHLFKKKYIKRRGVRMTLSLLLAFLVIILIFALSLWIIIPQLIESFRLLANNIPNIIQTLRSTFDYFSRVYPDFRIVSDYLDINTSSVSDNVASFFKDALPNTLLKTYTYASDTFGMAATILIALIFSVYILTYKKKLGRQARQILYAYLPENRVNRILYIFHLANTNFSAFIFGQCLEAFILFGMYVIVALIFRLPYAFMIATIIGIFSLIPLFGAWIGWAIGVFLILMQNPWQALIFTIVFFIISQIEGNIIYPRIVGDTIGLPGIWVLAAITIGGNMLGIMGMIISVPIAAMAYTLVSESTQKALRKKTELVEPILKAPNWKYYNPETNRFEKNEVHLDNVLVTSKKDETDDLDRKDKDD